MGKPCPRAKSDKLVGCYYVARQGLQSRVAEGVARGLEPKEAEAASPIMQEARAMLQRWEDGDAEVVELWKTMNGWVYEGFNATYEDMGATFDKLYYESDTYLWAKSTWKMGSATVLPEGGRPIWVDLTEDGLDEKPSGGDGTAVYMTQDIGTAILDLKISPSWTVRSTPWATTRIPLRCSSSFSRKGLPKQTKTTTSATAYRAAGGQNEIPEGTVVDADDLPLEMRSTARDISDELGKVMTSRKKTKPHWPERSATAHSSTSC